MVVSYNVLKVSFTIFTIINILIISAWWLAKIILQKIISYFTTFGISFKQENEELEAFGDDAEFRFVSLDPEQQKTRYCFRNFKMFLYGENVRFNHTNFSSFYLFSVWQKYSSQLLYLSFAYFNFSFSIYWANGVNGFNVFELHVVLVLFMHVPC